MHVLLVGAGMMAREYIKVLDALEIDYTIISRGKEKAESLKMELGKKVVTGGLEAAYNQLEMTPTHAIVATTFESLEENTIFLLKQGIKKILVEKPGTFTKEGTQRLLKLAEQMSAEVYIAYNRRFYTSVLKAKSLISNEGGITSFLFEFTEWNHKIIEFNKTQFQFNNWFIGNSTHIVDLAFYFGGKPKEISSFIQSKLDWHPNGSIYTGAGITESDILFSYHANWAAPGSWKLELLTLENRYVFRPLEKLRVQKLGSVNEEEIILDGELDILYKPGLYKQTKSFLCNDSLSSNLLNVEEFSKLFFFYERINGRNIET